MNQTQDIRTEEKNVVEAWQAPEIGAKGHISKQELFAELPFGSSA